MGANSSVTRDMTALWILIFAILGKLAALAKDIAFAGLFGAGVSADAYFVANQIPGIAWLAVYGTIVSVFAPIYVRRMVNNEVAGDFANEAIRYYIYFAVLMTAICWAGADALVWIIAPSLDVQTHALAVDLTRIMVLGFALTGYVGVQSAIQQAHRRFIPPLAVPVVNNLLAILAILLAWYWDNVAIAVVGAVGAYLVQAVIQRLQTLRFYATELKLKVSGDVVKRLTLLSAPVSVVLVLDQLNILVGNAFASDFSTGAVAQFNYANRLALFVAGVFSWLVSYVFFPSLAHNAAEADDDANAVLMTRALATILIATAPAAAGALAMRSDIVAFIYQRGAFDAEDVVATAGLFGFLGVGIIFAATRELLNRAFFSYQHTAAPLLAGIVAIVANIVLSLWLVQQIGLSGIALGNALSAIIFFLCQMALLKRWKPRLLQAQLLRYAIAVAVAALAAYFSTKSMAGFLPERWPVLLRLALGGVVLVLTYLPVLALLGALLGIPPRRALSELTGRTVSKRPSTSDGLHHD